MAHQAPIERQYLSALIFVVVIVKLAVVLADPIKCTNTSLADNNDEAAKPLPPNVAPIGRGRIGAPRVDFRHKLIVTPGPSPETGAEQSRSKRAILSAERISSKISLLSRSNSSRPVGASRAVREVMPSEKQAAFLNSTREPQQASELAPERHFKVTSNNETTTAQSVRMQALDKAVISVVENFLDKLLIGELCEGSNCSAAIVGADEADSTSLKSGEFKIAEEAAALKPAEPVIIPSILNTRPGGGADRPSADLTGTILEENKDEDSSERLSSMAAGRAEVGPVGGGGGQFSDRAVAPSDSTPMAKKIAASAAHEKRATATKAPKEERDPVGRRQNSSLIEKRKEQLRKVMVSSVFGTNLPKLPNLSNLPKLRGLSEAQFSHILSDLNFTRHGTSGSLEHWLRAITDRKAMRFMHFG